MTKRTKRRQKDEKTNPLIIAFGVFMFLVLIYYLSENKNKKSGEEMLEELETSFKDPDAVRLEQLESKYDRIKHPVQIPDGDTSFDVGKLQEDLARADLSLADQVPRYSFDGGARVNVEESNDAMSPFSSFYDTPVDNDVYNYISEEFHNTDGKRFATTSGYNQFNLKPKNLLGEEISTPKLHLDFSQQSAFK